MDATTAHAAGNEVSGAIEVLSDEECFSLLAEVEVGRLAVAVSGEVDIFPINFAVDGRSIVFRTAEGTKLVEVVLAGRVAFEIDGYHPAEGQAWSVVVKGDAEIIDRYDDIYEAENLPLFPWNSAPKGRFVRIVPDEVTGRRFVVARTRTGTEPQL
ncbi:MAG: pyridoxamine 5'-phosphate oxidase family protein [Kineosporiaceae bacterium]